MTKKYISCNQTDVPAEVRFDAPPQNQGQIIVVEYGDHGRAVHGPGARYKRVINRQDGSVAYYRAVETPAWRVRLGEREVVVSAPDEREALSAAWPQLHRQPRQYFFADMRATQI